LSIVRTFADLIGARVTVESEVGRGTTFVLWLAATGAPDAPTSLPVPPVPHLEALGGV
jgi:light-regulated signal transduction histidine kinase (bacteriophytochrome)